MSQVRFVESGDRLSFEKSETGKNGVIGHLYANSWGIYLFAIYPYLAGGIDEEGQPVWDYWSDVAHIETVVALIRAEGLRQGATHVVDLQTSWLSEWSPSSLIFWIVEAEASANAIRVVGDPPPDAIPLESLGPNILIERTAPQLAPVVSNH